MFQMDKVKAQDLQKAIMKQLNQYTDEVVEDVKKATRNSANKAIVLLRKEAPKLTGVYSKSFRVKEMYESNLELRTLVHSPKEYPLTHLLENGHKAPDGSFVAPKPHWAKVEEKISKEFQEEVEKIISGG